MPDASCMQVGRLKVIKQHNLKVRPMHNIALDRIPGICRSIKQGYCHLTLLDVIRKFNQLEVHIKLVAEPTH